MADLSSLAERCEQATGPDRELDARIWGVCVANPPCAKPAALGKIDWPRFTASLDAAMSLVPEGASIDLRTGQTASGVVAMVHPPAARPTVTARAATAALALCAASLRARAATK